MSNEPWKEYERETARLFREIYPDAKRHLEYQSHEAEKGFDVSAGPFLIQCKRRKNWVPANTIYEVQPQEGKVPLLVCRTTRRGCESLVVMKKGDFNSMIPHSDLMVQWVKPKTFAPLNEFIKWAVGKSWRPHHFLRRGVFVQKSTGESLAVMLLTDFLQALKNEVVQ